MLTLHLNVPTYLVAHNIPGPRFTTPHSRAAKNVTHLLKKTDMLKKSDILKKTDLIFKRARSGIFDDVIKDA